MNNNDYYVQKIKRRLGKYYSVNIPSKLISKLQLDTSSDSPNYCKIYFDPQNEQLVFKRLNLEELA